MGADRLFAASVALYAVVCSLTNMALYGGVSPSTVAAILVMYEAILFFVSTRRMPSTFMYNAVAAVASISPILVAAILDSEHVIGYLIAAEAGVAVYVLVSSMCRCPRKSADG